MSRLNKVIRNNTVPIKKEKERKIPLYDANGHVIRMGNEALKKRISIAILVITGLYIILYFPGIFIKDKKEIDNEYVATPDIGSVKIFKDYLAVSGDKDFDRDGLSNGSENEYGTNPYEKDSDYDGVDDYYEVYVTKTDPAKYDNGLLLEFQKKIDSDNGNTVDTPYKCNNVIMWADNYDSKAYGGVIETPKGFHFSNFNGYVQFPKGNQIYAYTNDNGKYKLLDYDKDNDVWYIDGYHNVEIFNQKIERITEYKIFGKSLYAKHNFLGDIMTFLLPRKGIIAAENKTREDVEPSTGNIVTANNNNIHYDISNGERFGQNTNSLQDLQFVRTMIDSNRCVEVSLYDLNDGEYRGIIYGYTQDNDLLVADENTLKTVGTIHVDEIGVKGVDKDGNYGISTYFTWYGLGFSSNSYDLISFFAVADEESNINATLPPATSSDAEEATETDAEETNTEEVTTEEVKEATPNDASSFTFIEILNTGEWDHSRVDFIQIMTVNNFLDKTNDEIENGYIKENVDNGTLGSYTLYASRTNGSVMYVWCPEQEKSDDVYKGLVDTFNADTAIKSEQYKDIYRQTKYTYENGSEKIIRQYADNTYIIFSCDTEMTDELKDISEKLGTTQTDLTESE